VHVEIARPTLTGWRSTEQVAGWCRVTRRTFSIGAARPHGRLLRGTAADRSTLYGRPGAPPVLERAVASFSAVKGGGACAHWKRQWRFPWPRVGSMRGGRRSGQGDRWDGRGTNGATVTPGVPYSTFEARDGPGTNEFVGDGFAFSAYRLEARGAVVVFSGHALVMPAVGAEGIMAGAARCGRRQTLPKRPHGSTSAQTSTRPIPRHRAGRTMERRP